MQAYIFIFIQIFGVVCIPGSFHLQILENIPYQYVKELLYSFSQLQSSVPGG